MWMWTLDAAVRGSQLESENDHNGGGAYRHDGKQAGETHEGGDGVSQVDCQKQREMPTPSMGAIGMTMLWMLVE